MKKNKIINRITIFFKTVYIQLVKINDTPQRIALGLGLGVFLGIFPGAGALAALFAAIVLRLNRAATLLGALLTNTWLSIAIFLLSIKIGSAIMRVTWQDVRRDSQVFLQNFHWLDLFKLSALKIILPAIIGYTVVGLSLGIFSYLITLVILKRIKYADKSRVNLSR